MTRVKGLSRRWTLGGYMNMLAGCGLYPWCSGAAVVQVDLEGGEQRTSCLRCLSELVGIDVYIAALDIVSGIIESPPFSEQMRQIDTTLKFLPHWRRDLVLLSVARSHRGESPQGKD